MRKLIVKYQGTCNKCGKDLKIGEDAMYEKHVGIFCVGCEPVDIEEIRAYKQERANRKAEKYEGWAKKRREKAESVLNYNQEHYRGDTAFNTQPGHIPIRAKVNKQDDKAYESILEANRMEEKAKSLRSVRVRGDADKERQAKRDRIKPLLKIGQEVDTVIYYIRKISKINKKTITTEEGLKVDISFLRI